MERIEIGTSSTATATTATLTIIVSEIANYWSSARIEEITFPIDCKLLNRLSALSPTGHVALRIENITNPSLVTASWMPFNSGSVPMDSAFYKVLDRSLINSLCTDDLPEFEGKYIDARIAKYIPTGETEEDFYVFFQKSFLSRKEGGVAGDPDPAGATVRPRGN